MRLNCENQDWKPFHHIVIFKQESLAVYFWIILCQRVLKQKLNHNQKEVKVELNLVNQDWNWTFGHFKLLCILVLAILAKKLVDFTKIEDYCFLLYDMTCAGLKPSQIKLF